MRGVASRLLTSGQSSKIIRDHPSPLYVNTASYCTITIITRLLAGVVAYWLLRWWEGGVGGDRDNQAVSIEPFRDLNIAVSSVLLCSRLRAVYPDVSIILLPNNYLLSRCISPPYQAVRIQSVQ